MNDRKEWVDYAKGIGITLVVYGHILSNGYHDNLNIPEYFYSLSRSIIYSFHMPLFFLLSGLFAEESLQKRGAHEYILDKLKRIAYPYFLWSILQIIIETIFSGHTQNGTKLSDIFTILYIPWGQFWYIYSLFLMHIAYAALNRFGRASKTVMLIIGLVLFFNSISTETAALFEFSIYFIYFISGIILRKYFIDMEKNEIPLTIILLLFAILIFSGIFVYDNSILSGTYRLLSHTYLSSLGIFSCMSLSQYLARKKILNPIKTLGIYSLQIYLVHMLAGAGTRLILQNYLHIQNWVLQVLISVMVALVAPIFLQIISVKFNFPYLFEFRKNYDLIAPKQTQNMSPQTKSR